MRAARWCLALVVAAGLHVVRPAAVEAQTRADTAAVLLEAVQRLRAEGETGAARALLRLIARDYAGTPAAAAVDTELAALRGMRPAERPGRTELLVWGSTYGAWLGVAVPAMLDADEEEVYGLGLLLGAPMGFLAARAYTNANPVTEGQARAITFGGTWGTWQGFGWTEVLGRRTHRVCPGPEPSDPCHEFDSGPSAQTRFAAAVGTGLAGIATGAWLARRPITAGTASAVSLGGMWGTWFGWGLGAIADLRERDLWTASLVGGNAGLVAMALTAPAAQVSEARARLVSISGVIGGLAGLGLLLIVQPDDDQVSVAIPVLMSAAGLGAGLYYTRDYDEYRGGRSDSEGGPGGGAALLERRPGAGWMLGAPQPAPVLRSGARHSEPAVYLPLVHVRF